MENIKTSGKKKLLKIYLIGLLLSPFVLFFLSSDFFVSGESICLSVMLFNQKCYGCGMTRAIQHLIHFEMSKALFYNKLSIIVLPLLIFIFCKEIVRTLFILKGKS